MSAFEQQIESWLGRPVTGEGGEPVGTLREVYLDEETGRPRWGELDSPDRGDHGTFVPVSGITEDGGSLRLAVSRDRVLDSPRFGGIGDRLDPSQEDELGRHYWGERDVASEDVTQVHAAADPEGEVTREHVAPTPPAAPDGGELELVRSEEQLRISKTAVPVERVRLIKRVVTETVTKTFEIRREELRVEREPVERATDGTSTGAGEGHGDGARRDGESRKGESRGDHFHDKEEVIVLMEEEVVVTKRVVPRERVRLVTHTVVEDRQVTDDLRREEIELERAELQSRRRVG